MELKKINGFLVAYGRQGNDKNGNPIYLINVFEEYPDGVYHNINDELNRRLDKHGNIIIKSYNIEESLKSLLQ